MIESIKFRGKTLNYDLMTMPEFAEGWYYQELHNGEMRHLITDGAHTFEVDGNTVEMVSGLFDKPLASRMTAEEKERVRKMYKGELEFAQFYQRKSNSCINQQCRMDYEVSRDIAKSRANMLESIFGAEFFKEGE